MSEKAIEAAARTHAKMRGEHYDQLYPADKAEKYEAMRAAIAAYDSQARAEGWRAGAEDMRARAAATAKDVAADLRNGDRARFAAGVMASKISVLPLEPGAE